MAAPSRLRRDVRAGRQPPSRQAPRSPSATVRRVVVCGSGASPRLCGLPIDIGRPQTHHTRMRTTLRIAALVVVVSGPSVASAQLATDYNPPRANCCLAGTAQSLADQLQDWNQLGRYYAANEELKKQPVDPKRVVFMGDSITDGWRLAEAFPNKPYVNRGISGQTTAQMLVRMYPDVIALKPAAMVVLAGTNDVARNNGPQTLEMIQQNFMAITELAQHHGIKVLFCAVTPINDNPTPPAGAARGTAAAAPPRR